MLNTIWCTMLLLSMAAAIHTGQVPKLAAAFGTGAQEAVTLAVSMTGMLCAWSGLIRIADKAGLTEKATKLFSPVIRLLFPEYRNNQSIQSKIAMNISANFLGLGNAATPLGLAAVKEMTTDEAERPTPGLMLFVVMNTASLQLLPTYALTLRSRYGSAAPYDILPCIWLVSLASLLVSVTAAKCFESWRHYG